VYTATKARRHHLCMTTALVWAHAETSLLQPQSHGSILTATRRQIVPALTGQKVSCNRTSAKEGSAGMICRH